MEKKNILWIDDDIDKLSSFVNSLREYNLNVFIANDFKTASEVSDKNKIDIFLVDLQMPHPDGIEMIRRLSSKHPNSKFAAMSSFLYLQKFKDDLTSLDIPVQLIDKTLPNRQSDYFKTNFIDPIIKLVESGITYTIEKYNLDLTSDNSQNPFDIEFSEFIRLPLIEKDKIQKQALEMTKNIIAKAFQRGKIWVLFCGNKNEFVAFAENNEQILSESDILDFAKRKNRIPFQFSQALTNDDHWLSCRNDLSIKDYPTVTLDIDGFKQDYHFDTGCPFTIFSYEELRTIGAIDEPLCGFTTLIRNESGEFIQCANLKDFDVILISQRDQQTIKIRINGQAIRDWYSTTFAKKCINPSCIAAKNSGKNQGYCVLRKALIGRNIITDNELKIILDGKTKVTHFKKA